MRLIDADDLKKVIISICGKCSNIIREYKEGVPDGNCAIQHIMNMIDNAPTVEIPVARWDCYCEGQKVGYEKALSERPQGEWITHQTGMLLWEECNRCHAQVGTVGMNFCPNCGAKMQKGGAGNENT